MTEDRLCVASYGEDVSWVADTGIDACIYDATESRPGLIPVPNEAREASQYIRHILAHYGDFREYEIFLQGNPFPHNPSLLTRLKYRPWKGDRVQPVGARVMPRYTQPRRHLLAAIAFAEELGIHFDVAPVWTIGAMFAASRESLMSYPKDWWERLLAKVIIEREMSPWAIERLWLKILSESWKG